MVAFTTTNITSEWHGCDISLLPFHVLYQIFPRTLSFPTTFNITWRL